MNEPTSVNEPNHMAAPSLSEKERKTHARYERKRKVYGDAHSLMYQTGTAHKWHKNAFNVSSVCKTNAVAVRSLACVLGVSAVDNFGMNSIVTLVLTQYLN
eukprot:922374_1